MSGTDLAIVLCAYALATHIAYAAICLRVRYAKSGTDLVFCAYALAMRSLPSTDLADGAMSLRARDAKSGTDLAYSAQSNRRNRIPGTNCTEIAACYAMSSIDIAVSGTDLCYAAMLSPHAMSGTEKCYAPTLCAYALTVRCPVPMGAMLLRHVPPRVLCNARIGQPRAAAPYAARGRKGGRSPGRRIA
eukprot:574916-Rhodomonas_salina.1